LRRPFQHTAGLGLDREDDRFPGAVPEVLEKDPQLDEGLRRLRGMLVGPIDAPAERQGGDGAEVLVVGRIIGIFLVAIGVMLALQLDKVADALAMLLGFASIMGVGVWAGVLWRRANAAGAWASVAVLFITWCAFGPVGTLIKKSPAMSRRLPEWVGAYGTAERVYDLTIRYLPAGVLTLIVVSLLTKPIARKKVDDFFMLLRTPVGEEDKLIAAGVPMVYAGSTKPNRWEIEHPHLVHWGGFLVAAVISAASLALLLLLMRVGA
jgi:hypothetical protein